MTWTKPGHLIEIEKKSSGLTVLEMLDTEDRKSETKEEFTSKVTEPMKPRA